MRWTEEQIEEAMDKIEERATTDMEFRNLCLDNAPAAIKEATGREVDSGYKISFVENAKDVQETHVLPDFVGEGKLSNADLDTVAGGGSSKHDW